jgi:hypothetical protein
VPSVRDHIPGFGRINSLLQQLNDTDAVTAAILPVHATRDSHMQPQELAHLECPYRLVDSLVHLHKSNNLLTLMLKEARSGNYRTVLQLEKRMSAIQRTSLTGVLLRMRALQWAGALTDDFFAQNRIADAEYFLTWAELLRTNNNPERALEKLDLIDAADAFLSSKSDISNRAQVCRGRILLRQALASKEPQDMRQALQVWRLVEKSYSGDNRQQAFTREARRAAQLLGNS